MLPALDGVARNQALIVFPASIRWLRRASQLFPALIERGMLGQFRQRKKMYETAVLASREPGIAAEQ